MLVVSGDENGHDRVAGLRVVVKVAAASPVSIVKSEGLSRSEQAFVNVPEL
jgi:hypothetical protein